MTHDELINKWKNPLFTDHDNVSTLAYLEVSERYYPLIDALCEQIVTYLKNTPFASPLYFTQVKECDGSLVFYYEGGDDYISGLVSMTEVLSSLV